MINKNCLNVPQLQGLSGMLMLFMLSACSSSPTPDYYTLQPKVVPLQDSGIHVIEVLPIGLPDRLDRSPLVIQDSRGRSKVLDNDRWTSTLSTQLRDGLSAGLQQKLGAVDRYNSGMTAGQVSYRIATDFSNFDAIDDSSFQTFANSEAHYIQVMLTWIIKRDLPILMGNPPIHLSDASYSQLSCRTSFTIPIQEDSKKIDHIVQASTQALNQVIENIAASVVMMHTKKIVHINGVTCS